MTFGAAGFSLLLLAPIVIPTAVVGLLTTGIINGVKKVNKILSLEYTYLVNEFFLKGIDEFIGIKK
jgi:ABC-type sulfate transport system permease component